MIEPAIHLMKHEWQQAFDSSVEPLPVTFQLTIISGDPLNTVGHWNAKQMKKNNLIIAVTARPTFTQFHFKISELMFSKTNYTFCSKAKYSLNLVFSDIKKT